MNAQDLIPLFGSRVGDAKLEAFLSTLGVKQRPKLAKGEFDAHLELKPRGVSLYFEDEAYFEGADRPLGKGPLVLVGAFLYAEGVEEFSGFEGELPDGLTFADTHADAQRKLGAPEWQKERNGTVRRARWARPGYKLSVDFTGEGGAVSLVYAGLKA